MLRTPKLLWLLILLLFLSSLNAFGINLIDDYDDYSPEANARVARIKILDGEANIKRTDNNKWEQATENLPIVEGDEITTGKNSRIELQFDKHNYLRLAENSYLKIVNLQNEGVAVSLSQGTMNLTIIKFDKDKGYFEIDAPQTTIAVQKEGKYRIDAGDEDKQEIRVIVSKWGQARVYSDESGFVLKNGRSARLFLEGTYAGEWETSRNSRFGDDFDEWTAQRDSIIERNLRNSYYNKYYDDSIYGADDLNDYGQWIYARGYGYVWRPYQSTISRYANWSPYRYGHWRWLPYHGWTWVNDESWGWATYHYGRWFHTNGNWVWSPYSNARRSRSYWRPAIVYISYIGDSYCWYPLPYGYGYYDYNRRYRRGSRRDRRNRRDRRDRRNNNPPNNPTRTTRIPAENIARANRNQTPPFRRVPRGGVVSVPAGDFGVKRRGNRRPPFGVADEILKRKPIIVDTPPLIPTYKDVGSKVGKDILVPNERRTVKRREVKTGVGERKVGTSLDEKLRRKTIYGNRVPQTRTTNTSSGRKTTVKTTRRGTGVFDRTQTRRSETKGRTTTKTKETRRSTSPSTRRSNTNNSNRGENRRTQPTTRNTKRTEPRRKPPVDKTQPRRTQPRQQPRIKPKPRSKPKSQPKPKRKSKPKSTPSKSKSKDKKN